MKYDVHLFPKVRVKIVNVEAESMEEAITMAEAAVDFEGLLHRGWKHHGTNALAVEDVEYAEELNEAHVDVQGDEDYSHSKSFQWLFVAGWVPVQKEETA